MVESFHCFKLAIFQQVIGEVTEKARSKKQEKKVEQEELDCTANIKDTIKIYLKAPSTF